MLNDNIINKVKSQTKRLFDIYEEMGLNKSAKQLSEDISGLMETAIEEFVEGAVAPKRDDQPDILLNGSPVEIKTTNGHQWRGGTFSKRPGYYLFVSWKPKENNEIELFVAGTHLEESDWKGSTNENYYATTYGKKELFANGSVEYFSGELVEYNRGKQKCISVKYS